MTSPSNSAVQNLLPVQAYFDTDDNFVTFIGQGKPFTASISPDQSGLNITNSTINSTTIGLTTPAAGAFTNIATTTGTITTAASGPTDIVNKQYVDYFAAGLSWKAPAITATSASITLSGLQTINGVTLVAGDIVLVKNQGTSSENGIYVASAGPWTYSVGGDTWSEYVGAIIFISSGSLNGTAWYCTAQPGGTLGVTAMNWSNFSVASTYTAGTGLTLIGTQFSITNTGVSAASYGSATASAVIAVNAQGQITSASSSTITPAVGSITGLGTGVATALAAGVTGSGNIVLATSPSLVTPLLGTPTSGDFSTGTFTWPTFNQNTTGTAAGLSTTLAIASGGTGQTTASAAFNALSPITTTGDLILGNGANSATRLAIGSNNQVLTSNGTTASWVTPSPGTTFSAGTTGFTPNTATSGAVTLAGTLNIANGGTGATSAPAAMANLMGFTTTATAAGTTTLTNTSSYYQLFTGSTTQTVVLPVTSTLQQGWSYHIVNNSTGALTVNSSGGNLVISVIAGTTVMVTCIGTTLTTAADWEAGYTDFSTATGTGSIVLSASPTLSGTTNINILNVTATATLAGSPTSNNTFGTNATTGTQTIGGTSQTGILTVGQSTVSQTTNIQAGATASGSTKTLNIGTGGLAGSTTNITIGSTTGTSTTTLNGTVNGTISNAANLAIVDDTTTNATVYPVWSNGTTGNQALETSSTKLNFNPSTGRLTATSYAGDGSALTGVGGFPSGTAMMFVQTSAPTGWTKSTTHDNKALRVVSGTASSGGSVAFTTAFASQAVSGSVGTSGATTLSTGQMPSHTHSQSGLNVNVGCCGNNYTGGNLAAGSTGSAGGGGSHTHSGGTFTGTAINLAVQYVDVIIATKD